jgi:hypothetical protein
MKSFAILALLPAACLAFVVPSSPTTCRTSSLEAASRRHFLTDALLIGAATTLLPSPALAAKKEVIPATHENVKAAFDALRYELNGKDGGVARMQAKIDEGDFEGLMVITQNYDQELRKGKVGRAKSFLPKGEKTITTMSANAITFDLIGMNRNARPGQENAAEANRYLNELRTDLKLVIAEEKFVEYED